MLLKCLLQCIYGIAMDRGVCISFIHENNYIQHSCTFACFLDFPIFPFLFVPSQVCVMSTWVADRLDTSPKALDIKVFGKVNGGFEWESCIQIQRCQRVGGHCGALWSLNRNILGQEVRTLSVRWPSDLRLDFSKKLLKAFKTVCRAANQGSL